MTLEHSCRQKCRCMLTEVGGKICDSHPFMSISFALPNSFSRWRALLGYPRLGTLELFIGRRRYPKKAEWRSRCFARFQRCDQLRTLAFEVRPVTKTHFCMQT